MRTFSLFLFIYIPITGTLISLSSSSAIIRCCIFRVVVHVSVLELGLSLTLEETNLGTEVVALGLKMVFSLKPEAEDCRMKLILGITILVAAVWFAACI